MGGHGSEQWRLLLRSAHKKTTDDLLALDVRELKREGHIVSGQENFIVTDGVEISLAWTPCNFGGSRPWFLCPSEYCGRRVAILYLDPEGADLLCRHCHVLTYESQYETPLERARRRAQKLRARLGVAPAEGPLEKPKGMHHKTFVRLGRQYLEAVKEYDTLYAAKYPERLQNARTRLIGEPHRESAE